MLTTLLTLMGGGLGGILRFVPEILKLFTDQRDRDHEYRMTELQLKVDEKRAALEIDKIHAEGDAQQGVAEMQAYIEAIKGQGQLTGNRKIDALNASVRPVVTYWWMSLFTVYKLCTISMAISNWTDMATFVGQLWTNQDAGVLAMILGFWFVDRSIRKNAGR